MWTSFPKAEVQHARSSAMRRNSFSEYHLPECSKTSERKITCHSSENEMLLREKEEDVACVRQTVCVYMWVFYTQQEEGASSISSEDETILRRCGKSVGLDPHAGLATFSTPGANIGSSVAFLAPYKSSRMMDLNGIQSDSETAPWRVLRSLLETCGKCENAVSFVWVQKPPVLSTTAGASVH